MLLDQIFGKELPKPEDSYEEAYREILELYDIAEALMATAEQKEAVFKDEQVEALEPLAEEVLKAADQLSEQFCEFVEASDKKKAARKFKLRQPFRNIFSAVNECLEAIYTSPADIAENITAAVIPAIERLVKHTEKLFGKLVVIIEKARDLVKNRQEFVDMISREAHIASMYHKKLATDMGHH